MCRINHPEERGICLAKAETVVIRSWPWEGQGEVDMCNPCAEATIVGIQKDLITHKQAKSGD